MNLWCLGMPGHKIKDEEGRLLNAPVRPFCKLELKHLPKKAKDTFKLQWIRIFQMMEEGVSFPLVPTNEEVKQSYYLGMEHLHKRMGCVFGGNRKPMNWGVSSWCKHAARSFIEKHGTEEDKNNLPAAHGLNQPRKQPPIATGH